VKHAINFQIMKLTTS